MKKTLLLAMGLALFAASVANAQAPPPTTSNSFRMYNSPVSWVTFNAAGAVGTSTYTWPAAGSGIMKSLAGVVSFGQVNLASEVTGVLPFANGGTGLSALGTAGQVLAVKGDLSGLEYVNAAIGSVTSFSAGNLSPLFTTSVSNASSTPALSFTLSNAGAYTVFGNNTGASAAPAYFTPVLASALFQNQGTANTVLHGNAAGNPTWSAVSLTADVSGTLPVGNGGTGATTLDLNELLIGNGTSAINSINSPGGNSILTHSGAGAPTWSSSLPSGVGVPFSNITTGTNTGAQVMTVGGVGVAASTLTHANDGVVDANSFTATGSTSAAVDLNTAEVNGTLTVNKGGTGSTAVGANGSVAYSNGSTYNFTAAGSSGQFMQSTGAGAPIWVSGSIAQARGRTSGTGVSTITVTPGGGINPLTSSAILVTYSGVDDDVLGTPSAAPNVQSFYISARTSTTFTVQFPNNVAADETIEWVIF